MNKKTGNFKNIEEFKATTGGLVSYFLNTSSLPSPLEETEQEQNNSPLLQGRGAGDEDSIFNKNLLIMHLVRCIGLLKYMEVSEVLPYYNESLIHLDIMFNSKIFIIKDNKVILNFNKKTWQKLKYNYLKNYKKLIGTYLEKKDAGEFLYNYVETDKFGNNLPRNKGVKEFVKYYYDLYKKIWNEVI